MAFPSLITESIFGSLQLMFTVATIVIPLITVLEILKETIFLEWFSTLLEPFISFLRLPKEAALPLVIGVVFGITYGAGVILQASREGTLKQRDFLLICLFFAINHGLIEDTLLFSRLGAKGWILLLVRFTFSVALIVTLGYILDAKASSSPQPGSKEHEKPCSLDE